MIRRRREPRDPTGDALRQIDAAGDAVRGFCRADVGGLTSWFDDYRSNHRRRLAFDLDAIDPLLRDAGSDGPGLLELGAVPLLLTAALHRRGVAVQAVDVAPERFAAAIEGLGLDVSRCDIEREALPFADRTFDLVLMNELFEHLRIQPIDTLEEVFRVLRPGGRLMLSTPNLRSLRGVRNLVLHNQGHASSAGVYRQYDKLRRLGHMGHVREYTTFEVCDFLERIGFEVEELTFRGGHGRGIVGMMERLLPAWRPFFSVVARVPAE